MDVLKISTTTTTTDLKSYKHLKTKIYDKDHNYNAAIQQGDPWDDVSNCNSRQVAIKNEDSEPGQRLLSAVTKALRVLRAKDKVVRGIATSPRTPLVRVPAAVNSMM